MIQTLRPDGKHGIWMSEDEYYGMQVFVIETLEEHDQLTLPELITIAEERLKGRLHDSIGYTVLHIKTDLLTRNVIRQTKQDNPRKKFPILSLRASRKIKVIRKETLVVPAKVETIL
jgi:hypothetical protein